MNRVSSLRVARVACRALRSSRNGAVCALSRLSPLHARFSSQNSKQQQQQQQQQQRTRYEEQQEQQQQQQQQQQQAKPEQTGIPTSVVALGVVSAVTAAFCVSLQTHRDFWVKAKSEASPSSSSPSSSLSSSSSSSSSGSAAPVAVVGRVADLVGYEQIKQTAFHPDKDVLVDFYFQACHNCHLTFPVLRQVAQALEGVESIEVVSADPDRATITRLIEEGLFSRSELFETPSLVLLPAGASVSDQQERKAVWTSGPELRTTGANLLRFLHRHATHKFDLDAALARNDALTAETEAAIERVANETIDEWRLSSPEIALDIMAPCGQHSAELQRKMMMASRVERDLWPEVQKAVQSYHKCTGEDVERFSAFWLDVKKFAERSLETAELIKQKKDRAAANNANKDDKTDKEKA